MKIMLATVGVALFSSTASALPIVAYVPESSGGGVPAIASVTADGVAADDLMLGAGLSEPAPGGNNFNAVGFDADDAAGARAFQDYITWGFTSTTAYDLTHMAINYGRGDGAPLSFLIEISVDGGLNYQTVHTYDFPASPAQIRSFENIDLSAFDGVTSAQFRLLGWSATDDDDGRASIVEAGDDYIAGTNAGLAVFGAEEVDFGGGDGDVTAPVPVPAAGAMLLLGLGGFGFLARRRG